jgi:uncharacterized protein involved in outer membrane biogenesis
MATRTILRRSVIGLGVVLAIAVAVLAALTVFEVPVNLNLLRGTLASAAGRALDAEVAIEGDLVLTPSLTPSLEIQGLSIKRTQGPDRFELYGPKLLLASVDLAALLGGELRIIRLEADSAEIDVTTRPPGLEAPASPAPVASPPRKPRETHRPGDGPFLALREIGAIDLRNLVLRHRREGSPAPTEHRLDRMKGAWPEGQPLEVTLEGRLKGEPFDLKLTGGSLDGLRQAAEPWRLDLSGSMAGVPLKAGFTARPAAAGMDADLGFKLEKVDLGRVLAWLDLAQGVEAQVGKLRIDLRLTGDSLSSVLEKLQVTAAMEQVAWTLRDRNTGAALDVALNKGEFRKLPGKPVSLIMDGSLGQQPVRFSAEWQQMGAAAREGVPIPLSIRVQTLGLDLGLDTHVRLPMKSDGLDLTLSLNAADLDTLARTLGLDLPDLKQISARGRFRIVPDGYRFSDFEFSAGQTRMQGDLSLATTGPRPALRVGLFAQTVQIEDFYLPERRRAKVPSSPAEPETELRSAFSPEVMASLDAHFLVRVERVLSGKDDWGHGSMALQVKDGRLDIKPVVINLPAGSIGLTLGYRPGQRDVRLETSVYSRGFDYGLLARMIDPQTVMDGIIDLDLDFKSTAPSMDRLLENGNGHLDCTMRPGDFRADVFDMWVVNLLRSVTRAFSKQKRSKVNCLKLSLDLKQGLMRQRAITIDTTQMRIQGTARVNFHKKNLELILTPLAKRPQFLSLATPIRVKGDFKDFRIGVAPGGGAGTVLQVLLSPMHVPLRLLVEKRAPADGRDVCLKSLRLRNPPEN